VEVRDVAEMRSLYDVEKWDAPLCGA